MSNRIIGILFILASMAMTFVTAFVMYKFLMHWYGFPIYIWSAAGTVMCLVVGVTHLTSKE